MSHFTVLVIGSNPEEQLEPFDENLRIEFKDKSEEYKKQYETEEVPEFFCDSSSSWGFQITKELFDALKKSKTGRILEYEVKKISPMAYLKYGGKYRGYYTVEGHKRCKGDAWFEVVKVLDTTHPDSDVCFEGKVLLRKIVKPKKIALKDKYPIYEDYLTDWHGIEDIDKQGYDFNPNAKWDWYQLGGRWTGFFILKSKRRGNLGSPSLVSSKKAISGTADQALKRDIDFDAMKQENFEQACKTYDEFNEKYKKGAIDSGRGYFEYGVRNLGKDAEHYSPESREEFLERCAPFSTFAVLKDGKWYEKGEMGWWGIVHDEKKPDDWNEQFTKLINELPDSALLSVYDCHI